MAFDINNFVIDRVLRGTMTSTHDGSLMYSINQIEEPSLNCSADEVTAVDALGSTIQTFQRAKNATFSGTNSLFDLGLLAIQMGSEKKVASTEKKIISPIFETIDIGNPADDITLKKTPISPITEIFELRGDSTLGKKYTLGAAASAENFAYDEATNKISLPTGIAAGSQIFVMYEFESDAAVAVVNSAVNFPRAGKFIMEVLGCDVCDPTMLIYAYLIFPNAKLDNNVEINLTTDGKHPFSIKAQQAYCDKEKRLFSIIVPQLD